MTEFHDAMTAAGVKALWEQQDRHHFPPEPAHLWPWHSINPLIDAAIAATDMHNAERRVLILNNPIFHGSERDGAVVNLAVNLQVLMPGERARPHRHSMHALRFVLEGEGVTTVVEGKPCPMLPGDMILTPGTTWHEHIHAGQGRCVWVDALDVPLHRYLRDPVFEPGPAHDLLALPADNSFTAAGLVSAETMPSTPYSPMFRYAWAQAKAALDALPAAPDGSRRLRYVHPLHGGAVMPTLDCYLLGLALQQPHQPRLSNCNTVCVVVQGTGWSMVGGKRIEWQAKDIFTLPHNQVVTHCAGSSDTVLFQVTDREILRRLELLREA